MRKYFLREGTIYGGEHNIYESVEEFQKTFPDIIPIRWARDDHTKIESGSWVESEDGYILECLSRKQLINKQGNITNYYRFPMGTFTVYYRKTKKDYKWARLYAYFTVGDRNRINGVMRTRLDSDDVKKSQFAMFLIAGISPTKSFLLTYGTTFLTMQQIYRKALKLMNDKIVVTTVQDKLQPFVDKLRGTLTDERLKSEIIQLLDGARKGTKDHRENLRFVFEILGWEKKKKNIEDAQFEEENPFPNNVVQE